VRIGVDLDGVCAKWTRGAMQMLNDRFNLDLDIDEEVPHWDWLEETIGKKKWSWLWTAGVERERLFRDLELVPGTLDALDYLTRNHEVMILTMRPRKARVDTIQWIAEHFPFPFEGIVVHKSKWLTPCDVYIDDRYENVLDIKMHLPDSHVFLRNRRYNQQFDWQWRVNDWSEFVEHVKRLDTEIL